MKNKVWGVNFVHVPVDVVVVIVEFIGQQLQEQVKHVEKEQQ